MAIKEDDPAINKLTALSGSRPDPDPTLRTMELVDKAIAQLRSELQIRFDTSGIRFDAMEKAIDLVKEDSVRVPTLLQTAILGLRELISARIDGMDKDIKSIHVFDEKRQGDITEQIIHLRELNGGRIDQLAAVTNEKFAGISSQFDERDTRTDQRAGDTKLAVDAAFAAAKEATAKIEGGFTKQIDQIGAIMNATNGAINDKVDDLKERLGKLETQSSTMGKGSDRSMAVISTVIAGVVGFVIIMGGLIALISFVLTRH